MTKSDETISWDQLNRAYLNFIVKIAEFTTSLAAQSHKDLDIPYTLPNAAKSEELNSGSPGLRNTPEFLKFAEAMRETQPFLRKASDAELEGIFSRMSVAERKKYSEVKKVEPIASTKKKEGKRAAEVPKQEPETKKIKSRTSSVNDFINDELEDSSYASGSDVSLVSESELEEEEDERPEPIREKKDKKEQKRSKSPTSLAPISLMSMPRKATAMISEEDLQKAMEESLRRRMEEEEENIVKESRDFSSNFLNVFEELDLDHDGFIGKEELRVCLALMGQPVREETLNLMLRLGDRNGDGFIDYEEFEMLMTDPKSRVQEISREILVSKQQLVAVHPSEKRQALVKKDSGDGTQQKVEIKRALASKLAEISQADLATLDPVTRRLRTIEIVHALLGVDTIRPRDIKVLHKKFQQADTKKVGKLSLFAFEKMFDTYNSIDNKRMKSNAIALLFSFCDTDNSNLIDAKEFIIGLCWLSDFGNIDKLRFAFMLFDANGNGKMDREELIQLIASVNMGRDSDRSWIAERVDEVMKAIAPTDAWMDYELSFEQLVAVADHNPDLFESMN